MNNCLTHPKYYFNMWNQPPFTRLVATIATVLDSTALDIAYIIAGSFSMLHKTQGIFNQRKKETDTVEILGILPSLGTSTPWGLLAMQGSRDMTLG